MKRFVKCLSLALLLFFLPVCAIFHMSGRLPSDPQALGARFYVDLPPGTQILLKHRPALLEHPLAKPPIYAKVSFPARQLDEFLKSGALQGILSSSERSVTNSGADRRGWDPDSAKSFLSGKTDLTGRPRTHILIDRDDSATTVVYLFAYLPD